MICWRPDFGEGTGDVCVDQTFHTDLYMQFLGVYIKTRNFTLRPLFYSHNKTFLSMFGHKLKIFTECLLLLFRRNYF